MEVAASFFIFVLGTIIGSFLNVVIARWGTGQGILGRSRCPACGHQLRWYELVPLLSFLVRRGRCGACHSRIAWQYPLVEALTGAVFVGIFLTAGGVGAFAYHAVIFSVFVVITVYDLHHKIIPNGLSYAVAALAFFGLFVDISTFTLAVPSIGEFLAGPLLFLPLFLLWWYSRGRWMGLGDAKLALSIGWLLGLAAGVTAFILAFWIGAAAGLLLIGMQRMGQVRLFTKVRGITIHSEIPFAPFLIAGYALAFFFHINIVALTLASSAL